MADRRELVLVRLLDIAKTIPGIKTVARNRQLLDDEQQPAIQIIDGDEEAHTNDPHGRPGAATRLVAMTPHVYITLGEAPEDVGTKLNGFRAALLKAIFLDASLKQILGPNGEIRYTACANAVSEARAYIGESGLAFTFVYPLIPSEL